MTFKNTQNHHLSVLNYVCCSELQCCFFMDVRNICPNILILSTTFIHHVRSICHYFIGNSFFKLTSRYTDKKKLELFMQWKGKEKMVKTLQSCLPGPFIIRTEWHQWWNHSGMNYRLHCQRERIWMKWLSHNL